MKKFIVISIVFILLQGCALIETRSKFEYSGIILLISAPHEEWQRDIVVTDFEKLNSSHSKAFFSRIVSKIKKIDISSLNCSARQVACVFSDDKNSIYLTPKYFKSNWYERMATLLHEVKHHSLGQYEHDPCVSKKILNKECDYDRDGAFGEEIIFFNNELSRSEIPQDSKKIIRSLITKTLVRINSTFKN